MGKRKRWGTVVDFEVVAVTAVATAGGIAVVEAVVGGAVAVAVDEFVAVTGFAEIVVVEVVVFVVVAVVVGFGMLFVARMMMIGEVIVAVIVNMSVEGCEMELVEFDSLFVGAGFDSFERWIGFGFGFGAGESVSEVVIGMFVIVFEGSQPFGSVVVGEVEVIVVVAVVVGGGVGDEVVAVVGVAAAIVVVVAVVVIVAGFVVDLVVV